MYMLEFIFLMLKIRRHALMELIVSPEWDNSWALIWEGRKIMEAKRKHTTRNAFIILERGWE